MSNDHKFLFSPFFILYPFELESINYILLMLGLTPDLGLSNFLGGQNSGTAGSITISRLQGPWFTHELGLV